MALRHYTDDGGRAGIEEAQVIFRGRDGRVFLTPDEYDSAPEAQRRLALSRTPSGYFETPEERLVNLSEIRHVAAHRGQPGGGREQYVEHRVEVSGLAWEEIGP